jgi:predicted metalloprotease
MVVVSVLAVAGLLTAIWHFTSLGYASDEIATTWNQIALPDSTLGTRAAPATASASATPSTSPTTLSPDTSTDGATAAPTKTASTTQVPSVLRANAIYGSPVTGSCDEQAKPATADDARAALTAYVDCMNTVWAPIFDGGRILFRPASITFYVNTIVNACTTLHTNDPITAMYCPMDATIYVSPTGLDGAVGNRFYGAELVTHEYAHHVQSLSQILAVAVKQGWNENEYSRRVQLQAHCLSFAVLNNVAGFGPDPAAFRLEWQTGPGSATHGSIASLQYWGERGLAAKKVGDCDTYSVPASAVA